MTDEADDSAVLNALAFSLNHVPDDPASSAPYPRGFALDLALETGSLKEILESYTLTPAQAQDIFANPAFRQEYEAHKESMQTEGWSFRRKCAAQAEAYLELLWRMAQNDLTPAPVRADIVKNTVKWAGLESTRTDSPSFLTAPAEMLAQLQALPDTELEMRVLQIISRKKPQAPVEKLIEGPLEPV